jgi:hypothetical protein
MLVRVGAPSREVNNGALCAIYHFFKRFDFSRLLSDVLLINSVLCRPPSTPFPLLGSPSVLSCQWYHGTRLQFWDYVDNCTCIINMYM